MIPLAQIPALM